MLVSYRDSLVYTLKRYLLLPLLPVRLSQSLFRTEGERAFTLCPLLVSTEGARASVSGFRFRPVATVLVLSDRCVMSVFAALFGMEMLRGCEGRHYRNDS